MLFLSRPAINRSCGGLYGAIRAMGGVGGGLNATVIAMARSGQYTNTLTSEILVVRGNGVSQRNSCHLTGRFLSGWLG